MDIKILFLIFSLSSFPLTHDSNSCWETSQIFIVSPDEIDQLKIDNISNPSFIYFTIDDSKLSFMDSENYWNKKSELVRKLNKLNNTLVTKANVLIEVELGSYFGDFSELGCILKDSDLEIDEYYLSLFENE